MSGTGSAIDTLSAEESALLNDMRDDAAPDAEQAVDTAPAASDVPVIEPDDDGDDGAEPGQRRDTVPHKQFHAERERRKAAETARQAAETKLATETAVANERLKILMEAAQTAVTPPVRQPDAIEMPDENTDPVGYFKAQLALRDQRDAERDAIVRGFQEREQQARAVNELRSWAQPQEVEFKAKEPSFDEAMAHLRESRHQELMSAGITDPMQREAAIANDITQIALKARQDNTNFAERLFNISVNRGFQKKAAAPLVAALDASQPLPDRVTTADQGRQNATTLATVGRAVGPAMTPDKIASMSDAAFGQLVEKMRSGDPAALRNLMGA